MSVRKQRSLIGNCLKFKLEEDFEVWNFKYLWKTVDRNVECSTKYYNYTVCGEDPQYSWAELYRDIVFQDKRYNGTVKENQWRAASQYWVLWSCELIPCGVCGVVCPCRCNGHGRLGGRSAMQGASFELPFVISGWGDVPCRAGCVGAGKCVAQGCAPHSEDGVIAFLTCVCDVSDCVIIA